MVSALQDRFGKPVAFRESVAAAQEVTIQVAITAIAGKDGKSLALATLGALADQIQYLGSVGYTISLIFSGDSTACSKASHAIESFLKLKEPVVTVPIAQTDDEASLAASSTGDSKPTLHIHLSHTSGVTAGEGKVVKIYQPSTQVAQGTCQPGQSLAHSAWASAQAGTCVVLASATEKDVLLRILAGQDIGTLFSSAAAEASSGDRAAVAASSARDMAVRARAASRQLQAMPTSERVAMLHRVADALLAHQDHIMAENAKDVAEAGGKITDSLLQRLILKPSKISQLADGIRAIAELEEPIGRMIRQMELADGLILDKITAPIGVLLIIFEARPDALPQIASLALRSGNGLMLKGGKEATHSNTAIHRVIVDAIGPLGPDLISLVQTREEINDLLALDDVIDLVIPRGSNSLVSHIQKNTKIPVLGHADGICHIYVDEDADLQQAIRIIVDAKVDYPAACNAVEKVLVHKAWVEKGGLQQIASALQEAGVELFAGDHVGSALSLAAAPATRMEYSALACTLEVVDSMQAAIDHIHKYGSSHTECIVTQDGERAEAFLRGVDSACVFHNASTRFADGFRFGLGAEVGISTSRIHARGPVGVEGLLTTKWVLRGRGHVVAKDQGVQYTHKQLNLAADSQLQSDRRGRKCNIM